LTLRQIRIYTFIRPRQVEAELLEKLKTATSPWVKGPSSCKQCTHGKALSWSMCEERERERVRDRKCEGEDGRRVMMWRAGQAVFNETEGE